MATVPSTNLGRIEFFENHVDPWTTHVTEIGLVIGDVTAVDTAAQAARAAYTAQQLARQAAKVATADLDAKLAVLQTAGSTALQKIRAAATAAGSGGAAAIYVLAGIPAPQPPSPVGNPGTPTDLKVTLNPDGSIVLTWKCANPPGSAGTIYNVRRKLSGSAAFVAIGGAGARRFVDETIPAGTASAVYEITAVRSTRAGTAGTFIVNFGVSTAGEAFATVAPPSDAPKLAA